MACNITRAPCEEKDGAAIQNQNWLVARGESQLLRLDGTEYCLHAGDTPANGNKVTVQRWYVQSLFMGSFSASVGLICPVYSSEIGRSPGAW
jgi:hypothetical protein